MRELADHFIEVAGDADFVILEIAKPGAIPTHGVGQPRVISPNRTLTSVSATALPSSSPVNSLKRGRMGVPSLAIEPRRSA